MRDNRVDTRDLFEPATLKLRTSNVVKGELTHTSEETITVFGTMILNSNSQKTSANTELPLSEMRFKMRDVRKAITPNKDELIYRGRVFTILKVEPYVTNPDLVMLQLIGS